MRDFHPAPACSFQFPSISACAGQAGWGPAPGSPESRGDLWCLEGRPDPGPGAVQSLGILFCGSLGRAWRFDGRAAANLVPIFSQHLSFGSPAPFLLLLRSWHCHLRMAWRCQDSGWVGGDGVDAGLSGPGVSGKLAARWWGVCGKERRGLFSAQHSEKMNRICLGWLGQG